MVEIYSRKQITVQLTEGISRQLRDWAATWMEQLKATADGTSQSAHSAKDRQMAGASQILCSYYYAVTLLSRPFLMYELHRRLSANAETSMSENVSNQEKITGRSRFADACIDAAMLLGELVQDLIEKDMIKWKAPLIV